MRIHATCCKGKRRNVLFGGSESGQVLLESKPCSGHWKARRSLVDLTEAGEADFPNCVRLSPSELGAF